eukprot:543133_1
MSTRLLFAFFTRLLFQFLYCLDFLLFAILIFIWVQIYQQILIIKKKCCGLKILPLVPQKIVNEITFLFIFLVIFIIVVIRLFPVGMIFIISLNCIHSFLILMIICWITSTLNNLLSLQDGAQKRINNLLSLLDSAQKWIDNLISNKYKNKLNTPLLPLITFDFDKKVNLILTKLDKIGYLNGLSDVVILSVINSASNLTQKLSLLKSFENIVKIQIEKLRKPCLECVYSIFIELTNLYN